MLWTTTRQPLARTSIISPALLWTHMQNWVDLVRPIPICLCQPDDDPILKPDPISRNADPFCRSRCEDLSIVLMTEKIKNIQPLIWDFLADRNEIQAETYVQLSLGEAFSIKTGCRLLVVDINNQNSYQLLKLRRNSLYKDSLAIKSLINEYL